MSLDDLLDDLAHTITSPDAFNQYAPLSPNNAVRRANLRHYLETMRLRKPQSLLLMEAPGYRGCRVTGIPMTSRKVMLEGIPELSFFGEGYHDVTDAGFEDYYNEQSATILWTTLAQFRALPLVWNTFPFHPHEADNTFTNRKPRKTEIVQGLPFIERVVELFQIQQVIAVGNVADGALTTLGITHQKVRHPAQGGKNDFVLGLTHWLTR